MSRFIRNLISGLKKSSSKDCDVWRDKLIGKVIINDNEQTTLGADEVGYKIQMKYIIRKKSDNAYVLIFTFEVLSLERLALP